MSEINDEESPIDAVWRSFRDRYGTAEEIERTDYLEAPQPVPTGIEPIDLLTNGGLRPGLHLVAGTPGAGKTSFTLFMGAVMAAMGRRVLYVSLEMSRGQCYARLASLASTEIEGVREFCWSEWERMGRKAREARERGEDVAADAGITALRYVRTEWPGLCVADAAEGLNNAAALYGAIEEARASGCEAVFVDYLQHIGDSAAESEYERVSAVSDGLNRCGVANGIPVVCVSTMGRGRYQKADGGAQDVFKGSGSLEYDAVSAWALCKGNEVDENGERSVDLCAKKNRFGLFGEDIKAELWFDAKHNNFTQL